MVPDIHDVLRQTRTVLAPKWLRFFVAPLDVNYHLEHHMVMHVPCWQLKAMHRLLLDKGLGSEMKIASGYGQALAEAGWRRA